MARTPKAMGEVTNTEGNHSNPDSVRQFSSLPWQLEGKMFDVVCSYKEFWWK